MCRFLFSRTEVYVKLRTVTIAERVQPSGYAIYAVPKRQHYTVGEAWLQEFRSWPYHLLSVRTLVEVSNFSYW